MIQTTFTDKTRYISCPACAKSKHAVSHLGAGCRTLWYCDDCGVRFDVHVLSADQVDCSVIPDSRRKKILVRLRSTRPVTVIVEGMSFHPDDEPDGFVERQRYYYEEHTCPSNFLGVEKVMDDSGDEDPHGIFSFVGIEPLA